MLAARALLRRAGRRRAGAYLVEGPRAVAEALAAGVVREVFVVEGREPLAAPALRAGVEPMAVTPRVLQALSDAATPQGIVAVAAARPVTVPELRGATLVTVLAGVSDPGNAGTLVRASVAAGADAVVFPAGSVDPYSPKAVRASAGLVAQARVVLAGSPSDALDQLRALDLVMVGADPGATSTPDDLDLSVPLALVLGSEAHGLGPEVRRRLDATVRIPMPGPAESLNVGMAGSILLFEVVRRRGVGG